ncbi:hypothetical protein GO685_02235 [Wolbachia endosymbiont of Madathamugadia hiepei]|uniref:hypothetical protein n=1 Tax=Wolbachia endosymbiont of Madathamugadia hiepei TaxID=1241303 RepID=UPI00158D7BFD|nr:hypothetical protein [Wolbachia endosymbiont of Madathamugadia hiepei]NUX01330.1 hypothetical protein [Wolbachia endosymbiont of Madathamugadia hiepei]
MSEHWDGKKVGTGMTGRRYLDDTIVDWQNGTCRFLCSRDWYKQRNDTVFGARYFNIRILI